ncbi:MAG TPA: hypothetical protein VFP54_01400 [Acidimicrobiales bacterium]|nr:hypothetical protein [Acidimicrobiales bacterium]
MAPLAELARRWIDRWGDPVVERVVFGVGDADLVAAEYDRFCRDHLGAPVADGRFYVTSVGCVAGVVLGDGRAVVIKAYQPRWGRAFLEAVVRVQGHIADGGFPCGRPLCGPAPIGAGLATAETMVEDPGQPPITADMLAVSAGGLARVVALCADADGSGLSPHPLDAPSGALYPEPHSPIFDFQATAAGAGWIDDLAVAARDQRGRLAGTLVVAHTDWSARNVRLRPEGVVAAFDWDSLSLVAETTAVGNAAATWSAGEHAVETAPSAAEVAAYTRAYQAARGRAFTAGEWDAVGAAALWVLAYTARCEHSLAPGGGGPQRARGRLRAEGDALLRLSELAGA